MDITLKDKVLELNQEVIFSLYFNISIENINWSTQYNCNKLNNPLRDDNDPSLTFKWFGNRLFARDWADFRYNGDIFKIVGNILDKSCNNNDDFVYICNDIIDRYYSNNKYAINKKEVTTTKIDYKNIKSIDCRIRHLNKKDYQQYNKFGILDKQIHKYVEGVYKFSIDDNVTGYKHSDIDPCYKYNININYTKLYFPFRNKNSVYPRFITNNILSLDDIHEIRSTGDILLLKSIKDKMLIEQFLDELSIKSILIQTLSSESNVIHPSIINILNKNTKYNIFAMLDIDTTGINTMNHFKEVYGYIPLYFNTKAKDPTDYVMRYGYRYGLQSFKENISFMLDKRNKRQIK